MAWVQKYLHGMSFDVVDGSIAAAERTQPTPVPLTTHMSFN